MTMLKAGRPSNNKEKALAQLQTKEETIQTSIKLPKSLYKQMKGFALERDITVLELIQRAVKQYMEHNS